MDLCSRTFTHLTYLTPWRNGSASDSRSEGCVFESRRGQWINFKFFRPILMIFWHHTKLKIFLMILFPLRSFMHTEVPPLEYFLPLFRTSLNFIPKMSTKELNVFASWMKSLSILIRYWTMRNLEPSKKSKQLVALIWQLRESIHKRTREMNWLIYVIWLILPLKWETNWKI